LSYKYYSSGDYESDPSCANLVFNNNTFLAFVQEVVVNGTMVNLTYYQRGGTTSDLSSANYTSIPLTSGVYSVSDNDSINVYNCTQFKLGYGGLVDYTDAVSNVTITLSTVEKFDTYTESSQYAQAKSVSTYGTDAGDVYLYNGIAYDSDFNLTTYVIADSVDALDNFTMIYQGYYDYNETLIDNTSYGDSFNSSNLLNYNYSNLSSGCTLLNHLVKIDDAIITGTPVESCTNTNIGGHCVARMNVTSLMYSVKLSQLNIFFNDTYLSKWSDRNSVTMSWLNLSDEGEHTLLSTSIDQDTCTIFDNFTIYAVNISHNGTTSAIPEISLHADVVSNLYEGASAEITEDGVYLYNASISVPSTELTGTYELVIDYYWGNNVGASAGGGSPLAVIGIHPVFENVSITVLPSNLNEVYFKFPHGKSKFVSTFGTTPSVTSCAFQDDTTDLSCMVNDAGLVTLTYFPEGNFLGQQVKTNMFLREGESQVSVPLMITFINLDFYLPVENLPYLSFPLLFANEDGKSVGVKLFPALVLSFVVWFFVSWMVRKRKRSIK